MDTKGAIWMFTKYFLIHYKNGVTQGYSVSAFTYEECLRDFSEYLKHIDYDYFEEISADEFYHPSK